MFWLSSLSQKLYIRGPPLLLWNSGSELSEKLSFGFKPSVAAAAAAKSLQSCRTLCNPVEGSPPGSSVPGILQASILEWVAISFSNAWKWKVKVKSLSRARLLATPWTGPYQAPPSMGFSKQEYWSGVNLAIRSSWSEPQSAPDLVFADCIELLHLWLQRI